MTVWIFCDRYGPISVHRTFDGAEKEMDRWRSVHPEATGLIILSKHIVD